MAVIVSSQDQPRVNEICMDLVGVMHQLSTLQVADRCELLKTDLLIMLQGISDKLSGMGINYKTRPLSGDVCRPAFLRRKG